MLSLLTWNWTVNIIILTKVAYFYHQVHVRTIIKFIYILRFPRYFHWNSFIGQFWLVVVQSLSRVQLSATPETAACQASLSFTVSQSLLKFMSTKSVMPSNHLIFCHLLPLLPSISPSIRVFSSELVLHIRWPKDWSFSISPSNEYSGLISFRTD